MKRFIICVAAVLVLVLYISFEKLTIRYEPLKSPDFPLSNIRGGVTCWTPQTYDCPTISDGRCSDVDCTLVNNTTWLCGGTNQSVQLDAMGVSGWLDGFQTQEPGGFKNRTYVDILSCKIRVFCANTCQDALDDTPKCNTYGEQENPDTLHVHYSFSGTSCWDE